MKFVMEKEGLSLRGPQIPLRTLRHCDAEASGYADEDSKLRGALLAMHEQAEETFRANLKSQAGEAARSYIAKRGLAPETVEHFGLGYSDRSGRALVRLFEQRGFPCRRWKNPVWSASGRTAASMTAFATGSCFDSQ